MSKQQKGTHGQHPRVSVVAKLKATIMVSYPVCGTAVNNAANDSSDYINYALPRVTVAVSLLRVRSSASTPAFFELRAGFLPANLIEKTAQVPLVCAVRAYDPPDIPTGELFLYAVIARNSSTRQHEKPSDTSIAVSHKRQAPVVARQFKNGDMTGRNQRFYRWSPLVRIAFIRRSCPLGHGTDTANSNSVAAGVKTLSPDNYQIPNTFQRIPELITRIICTNIHCLARQKPPSTDLIRLDSL